MQKIKKKEVKDKTEVLKKFIQKSLKQGHSIEVLKKSAIDKGWPSSMVNSIFKNIKLPKKTEKLSTSKSKELERIPTGIPGLDEILDGGFEEYSINLVGGGAGTGKSILAMQYLVVGATKYNEPGVYVSFEETKENVYKHMLTFGWDLYKLEEQGKLVFIEYTPEQVKKMLDEGGGLIENLMVKMGAKRIVIDSISAFGLLFQDELSRRESLLRLFSLIRKWETTALLVAEFEPIIDNPTVSSIEFEVDSIILLYYPRKGDVRKRALEVLKMRGTEHSKKVHAVSINEHGITVYHHDGVF